MSLTCDGPTLHQSMLKLLGVKLSPDNLKAYFQHPYDPNAKIYIFLDACHMIKLVRNVLSVLVREAEGQKYMHTYFLEGLILLLIILYTNMN